MVIKGSLEKARFYIESHTKNSDRIHKKQKPGPCITISRETGAGADLVSEKLSEFLQQFNYESSTPWTVFDRNLIEKVIEDHHLPQKLSQYLVEDKLSELKSTVNELLGIHPHVWVLVSKTSNTIMQLAQIGNCIIVGRAGNIITSKLKNSFHVRLIAPVEPKIQRIMDKFNKTRKEAIEFIKEEDIARKNYLKKYFNKDVDDLSLYNIVINTGLVGYLKAAKIIGRAVMETYPDMFNVNEESLLYDEA